MQEVQYWLDGINYFYIVLFIYLFIIWYVHKNGRGGTKRKMPVQECWCIIWVLYLGRCYCHVIPVLHSTFQSTDSRQPHIFKELGYLSNI